MAVEDPGYTPARRLFESLGLRTAGVRVDAEGIVVDELPSDARLYWPAVPPVPARDGEMSPAPDTPRCHGRDTTPRSSKMTTTPSSGSAVGRSSRCSCLIAPGGYLRGHVLEVVATRAAGWLLVVPQSIHHAIEAASRGRLAHSPCQHSEPRCVHDPRLGRHVRRMRVVYRERHDQIATILRRDLSDELRCRPRRESMSRRLPEPERDEMVCQAASRRRRRRGSACGFRGRRRQARGFAACYGAIATEHIDEGFRAA